MENGIDWVVEIDSKIELQTKLQNVKEQKEKHDSNEGDICDNLGSNLLIKESVGLFYDVYLKLNNKTVSIQISDEENLDSLARSIETAAGCTLYSFSVVFSDHVTPLSVKVCELSPINEANVTICLSNGETSKFQLKFVERGQ